MTVHKKLVLLSLLGIFLLTGALTAHAQDLSGTVTDASDGSPLPGANVYIASLAQGTATDRDGNYRISSLPAGTHTVIVSFTGYQNVENVVTLSVNEDYTLDVTLIAGIELDPIQITAGRRQAKALDAPASIDVITEQELAQETAPSPVKALRHITGVDIAQTGIDRHEVVLRGFNNAFSGSAYLLTDYRQSAVPSLGVNVHSILPSISIDLDRVEIVRGPGSALYGPGVTHGVVHYITKDPFTHPGMTISVRGGEQSVLDFQGRIAGTIGQKLGLKLTGAYTSADDFKLEACDPSLLMQARFSACPDSLDAQQIAIDGIRDNAYNKANVNGNLEYRFSNNTSLILNAGYSQVTTTLLSGVGTVQADKYGYSYGQVRFHSGNFFAQASINQNHGGDSYIYGSSSIIEEGQLLNFQAQQDISLFGGREQIIFGVDVELTRPSTGGTILGRNEGLADLDEYGAYLQSTTTLSDKVELTLAARGDYNNIVDKFQFSPRAAIIYKPTPTGSVRFTYNRAFSSPGTNSNYLDVVGGEIPGTGIIIRARGLADGYSWERNAAFSALGAPTDLVASSLIPGMEGRPVPVGLPTADVYGLLYQSLATTPASELVGLLANAGIAINESTVGILVNLLHPENTQVSGFSPGTLGLLNISTLQIDKFPEDLAPIQPLKQTTLQNFEVGYRGILNDKFLIGIDGYYTLAKDFIGPLAMETPFVLTPTLAADLTRDMAAGISDNTTLAGALGLFGLTPEAVAGLLVQLATQAGGLPSPTTPVAIVQPIENNTGAGNIPELMLTYRNFGDVAYYGVDVSMQYLASSNTKFFGNLSWVNDDFFDSEELGEDDASLVLALNAPTIKLKFGGLYTHSSGVSVNAAARYTEGFPVRSGAYIGDVESYFLVDLGAGYTFHGSLAGLRADLGISNVLDSNHREFIGAPKLGRVAIGRLTYTLDFRN